MKAIIRGRDSGKAQEMLAFARRRHASVITQDKRAFKVKADGYGYDDIPILDYEDLKNDNYDWNTPVVVHNADKMLYSLLDKFYGLTLIGYTATTNGDEKNVQNPKKY